VALQLLINALATISMLYLLINLLAPISGGHFNPVVTAVSFLRKKIDLPVAAGYLLMQVVGAILGTFVAHLLFDRVVIDFSEFERGGVHLLVAEAIATFGLVVIVFADWKRFKIRQRASMISLWIGSAYFFTSSTSFANPAVTVGRLFTDTFAGIAPVSVPPFVIAQSVGALLAWYLLLALKSSVVEVKK
jgi:glycerol uptake facilitator-like aquaporin